MQISFIGLGNMGKPLAENILKAGESLTIFSSKKATEEHFKKLGAKVVPNITDLASSDILCTCVPRPENLLDLMLGDNGLYNKMRFGSLHLDFSTIDPQTAETLEEAAEKKGLAYVQATVSKTPQVAYNGESPFFAGGKKQAVDRVFPLLQKIGKPEKVGSVKAACFIKILSNQMGMAALGVLAEGLKLADLAGLDLKEILRLLETTGAYSFQMHTRGPWIINNDYEARFAVDLALKDLSLGEIMAKNLDFQPPMITQAFLYMREAQKSGLGSEDMCAIYKIVNTQHN